MTTVATGRVGIEGNGRLKKLRGKMLATPEVCVERGYWVTESYKETEGEPTVIRRAKSLQKVLQEMPADLP